MELLDIIQIQSVINDLEKKLKENGKELIKELYDIAEGFNSQDIKGFNIINSNEFGFILKIFDYEIYIQLMDDYAIPKPYLKNVTLKDIADNKEFQKYFCSSIFFYYCNKNFNENILTYLDRAFINKDFHIGFEGSYHNFVFDTKESILPNLKQILLRIINRIYNTQPCFCDLDDVYQLDRKIIVNRKFNGIGFK